MVQLSFEMRVRAFQLITPLGYAIDRSSTCIHLLMRTLQKASFVRLVGYSNPLERALIFSKYYDVTFLIAAVECERRHRQLVLLL